MLTYDRNGNPISKGSLTFGNFTNPADELAFQQSEGVSPGGTGYTYTVPTTPVSTAPAQSPYEYATPAGSAPQFIPSAGGSYPSTPTYRPPTTRQGYSNPAAPTSTSQTTTWTPSGDAPTYEAGSFTAPTYDQNAVKAGQQRYAAPTIRRLREQVQIAQGKTYDNPNVKGLTTRQALEGYGSGLESAMAGAYSTAVNDYNQQYQREWSTAVANFNAAETAKAQNFNAALQAWSKSGTTTVDRDTGTTSSAPKSGGRTVTATFHKVPNMFGV